MGYDIRRHTRLRLVRRFGMGFDKAVMLKIAQINVRRDFQKVALPRF
jgi:hypothetical protein